MTKRHPLLPHYYKDCIEAGCDEAGRGCLAGSVYAAAVILPADYDNPDLNDSKQMSHSRRYALRQQIMDDAVAWAVGVVTPEEIDQINILNASILAKTFRDDYMDALDDECPQYGWRRNKGYPTREHREAIRQHGITPYHRRSYNLTGQELPLPFDD